MKLFEYQKTCLEKTENQNNVAFFLDMGLGKTFVGSEKAMSLNKDILLICQKSKIDDWKKHFFEYYIDKLKCDESGAWCYDLTSSIGMDMFFHSSYRIKIGIINYDLVFRRPELLKLKDFTLMLDESSIIQNKTAKRTKFILKMKPKNVILLSGTPTDGRYERLWTQAKLLGWKISEDVFLKTYVNFKTIEVEGFIHKIVDPDHPYKNVERLKRKLREHGAIFMKTEEVIELPPQNFIEIKVKKIKEYNKFYKNSYVEIGDEELVGETTLTKMIRLRQLCSYYNEHKLTAFKDLLESTNDRVIVFYTFTEELHRLTEIARSLGKTVSQVNGAIKDLTSYKEDENSVTFVQYQAGAMGLNLQKANKIIYFTLPLKSEHFEQSKKRIHRIGQDKPCFYYLMIVEGSIEEDIKETLEKRKDYTDELFEERNLIR